MLDWNTPANSKVEFKEEAPKSKNVTASDKRVINGKGDINQLSHPKYPWAYEYFDNSLKNFWTPNEINMGEDIPDFTQKLTPEEQHMFVSVLGYLTTSDVLAMRNIGVAFMEKMCAPELQIFQASQIFQEAVHSITYKRCIEMLRLDEDDVYNRYRTVPEIARKIKLNNKILEPILDPHIDLSIEKNRNNFVKAYIFFSAIFEGCWFYNGFSPIFSLARRGLMKRTVEQLQYILRDECLAPETEVLTPMGWIQLQHLTEGTEVLQYNPDGSTEFVVPSRIVKNHFSGEMLHFKNEQGHFEQVVTPNHRIPSIQLKSGNLSIELAKDIKLHPYKALLCNGSNGVISDSTSELTIKEQFAIAVQADGHSSLRYTGEICKTLPVVFSFAKQRKCNRLNTLLDQLGYSYSCQETKKGTQLGYRVNVPVEDAWTLCKVFSWVNLKEFNSQKAKAFIEEIAEWDGSRASLNRVRFDGVRKEASDIVTAIATLAGYRVMTRCVEDKRSPTFNPIYRNYIVKNRAGVKANSVSVTNVSYAGNVYCVTVPSGMFICRYKQSVSVTGNCSHANFGIQVIRQIIQEEDITLTRDEINDMWYEAESAELGYANYILPKPIMGYSAQDHIEQFRFIANRRARQLTMPIPFEGATNALPWLDEMANMRKEKNFFESKIIDYQTGVSLKWD